MQRNVSRQLTKISETVKDNATPLLQFPCVCVCVCVCVESYPHFSFCSNNSISLLIAAPVFACVGFFNSPSLTALQSRVIPIFFFGGGGGLPACSNHTDLKKKGASMV